MFPEMRNQSAFPIYEPQNAYITGTFINMRA